jgi:hypothetical protein
MLLTPLHHDTQHGRARRHAAACVRSYAVNAWRVADANPAGSTGVMGFMAITWTTKRPARHIGPRST